MAGSHRLKIASYNIHKAVGTDGKRDHDRVLAVLRELDADIVALQECDRRFGRRASVLPRALVEEGGWRIAPVARRRASMGWHGNALLHNKRIECFSASALALPMLEPRGAVSATLGDESFRLHCLGMHLDLSGFRRRDQIRAILRHCARAGNGEPTVLLGDFNQWTARRGMMEELDSDWAIASTGLSFPSRRPVARLDRIVVSRGINIIECGVHHSAKASVASDHLPIWAEIELPNIQAAAHESGA